MNTKLIETKLVELFKTESAIALQIAELLEKESKCTQTEMNFDEEPEEVKRTRRAVKHLPFGMYHIYKKGEYEVIVTVNKETAKLIAKSHPGCICGCKLTRELRRKALELHPDYQEFQQYPISELF